jgi:signal transduction histidine kinase
VIDILQQGGAVRRLPIVFAHGAPANLIQGLQALGPPRLDGPGAVARVLRTGQRMIMPVVTDEMLAAGARNKEHLRILRSAGMRSSLLIPLIARGSVLGVLTLVVTGRSGRSYDEADVTLAEELARRAAQAIDNARLYAEAGAAIHARDEFLMIASHELRTPVTVMRTASQLLQRERDRGQLDEARLVRAIGHITQASERLASLTEDLLDVSRLQTGQFALRITDLDLGPFVQEIVERWREQLGPRHPLGLEVADRTPCVRADPARLDQVLANLLGNAAKYSPQGGPIQVSVQPDGGGARVEVRDQGIGLPPNAEEIIFRPFGRTAAAVRRQIQGLGLGLYICRQIMERHGGRIWAEHAHGQVGAVFGLWLPAASATEAAG